MIDEDFSLEVDNIGRFALFRESYCALDVVEAPLPPAGSLLLLVIISSEEVIGDPRSWRLRMLRDDVTSKELKVQMVYQGPVHRYKSVTLNLAERLRAAGVLGLCEEVVEFMNLVGVDTECPDEDKN